MQRDAFRSAHGCILAWAWEPDADAGERLWVTIRDSWAQLPPGARRQLLAIAGVALAGRPGRFERLERLEHDGAPSSSPAAR